MCVCVLRVSFSHRFRLLYSVSVCVALSLLHFSLTACVTNRYGLQVLKCARWQKFNWLFANLNATFCSPPLPLSLSLSLSCILFRKLFHLILILFLLLFYAFEYIHCCLDYYSLWLRIFIGFHFIWHEIVVTFAFDIWYDIHLFNWFFIQLLFLVFLLPSTIAKQRIN